MAADGESESVIVVDQKNQNDSRKPTKGTPLLLPVARVRTIMKSSPDVENISQDALAAVTAATEIFIRDLSLKVYASSKPEEETDITYNHLAALVNSEDAYGFLDEIVPTKVLGRDILAERRKQNGDQSSDNDEMEEKAEDEETSDP